MQNEERDVVNKCQKIKKDAKSAPILKKMAEIIYVYYVQREVATMFLGNVVEYVINSNRTHILSKGKPDYILRALVGIE